MKFALLSLILLSAQLAMAQDTAQDICQLNLHNCEVDDTDREAIERGIKMMIGIYKKVFDLEVSKSFQIKFQIFGSHSDYTEYRGGSTSAPAYYSVKKKEVAILNHCECCSVGRVYFIRRVYHEASHAILHEHLWHPKWLQEGIAEYFERMEVYDDKAVIGFAPDRNRACQEWLKEGQLMSLADFFSLSKSQYKKQEAKMRTFGWLFVYFLMSSEKGQGMLKNIIWEMNQAAGATPSIWNMIRFKLLYNNNLEIIKRAIPQDLEALDREWRAWIPQRREQQVFLLPAFSTAK